MRTILITGGAGFIGSHLCRQLLDLGNKIICLDNFSTGQKNNVKELLENKYFKLIEHDIVNPVFFDEKIDLIYNLACPASPVHYQANPIHTIKTNTIGVINLLNLAEKYGARILQASTSEVYGDPLEHPQKEDYKGNVNTIGPRACYDEGKRMAEALFFDYRRQYGIDIRVARIFNTYGPMMAPNDGRVVSNFIIQALHNVDITIYGKGEQTRSFCYVLDLIRGLQSLMDKENFIGPVNLGNPYEITILEIAKKIIELTGSSSKIIFTPLPKDDPQKRKPDIELAKAELDWSPQINLEDGLIKTIEYFRNI
ncbi:MAG: NAD-dependent dehydratase [Parcubacteria group bacterium CG10_big_fil_rev_8_21_14_0_10_36_14]|nr:MAG: NAD-dependent dehydratase [Parcubacteria group bacterium CG10_big_fil_rev_8_21_14_0_10_36_14]